VDGKETMIDDDDDDDDDDECVRMRYCVLFSFRENDFIAV
jgi:hypothetical protein